MPARVSPSGEAPARDAWPAVAAAAAGVAWLLVQVGPRVLDPRFTGWLAGGDWFAAQSGWTFFRHARWAFPPGANPTYPDPIGSTLGYSDAVPLAAIALKPFAALLPDPMQFLGPWLALCFALQGLAGERIVALFTRAPLPRALGGALFAVAPLLARRIAGSGGIATGHASLGAHWVVLAALWLNLAPCAPGRARRRLAWAVGLVAVAAAIHPYLAFMALAGTFALALRLAAVDRAMGAADALLSVAVAAAALVAVAWFAGFADPRVAARANGFGYFVADVLALVSPQGASRLWTGPAATPGEAEGFAYLGAGALLVCAVALALAARRVRPGGAALRVMPFAAVAVALALFALGDPVRLAGEVVLRTGMYDRVPALTGVLRSTGRFVWPLHDLVLAAAIGTVVLGLRPRPAALLLGAAVAIQAVEFRGPGTLAMRNPSSPPAAEWSLARGAYARVVLVPPVLLTGSDPACPVAPGRQKDLLPAVRIAERIGATVNSGYLARVRERAARAYCSALAADVSAGRLDPAALYLPAAEALPSLRAAGATCGVVDGVAACVRPARDDALARALRAR